MLVYFEERKTFNKVIYKVRSWRLFGVILLLRRWEQMTVKGEHVLPSEKT